MSEEGDLIQIAPKGAKFSLHDLQCEGVDPEEAAASAADKAKGAAKLLQSGPAAVNAGRRAGAGNAMLFHTWDDKDDASG